MRTILLSRMLDELKAVGLPGEVIHPCDEAVSLVTSRWVRGLFTAYVLSNLKQRNLQMRRNKFDCEDVAMAVRGMAVECHQMDPRDDANEDPTGVLTTGIAVGFVFIPGHSINVIITSDAPDEVTVRFFD